MESLGEPIINLNSDEGTLLIAGVSMMENTIDYYQDIKNQLAEYLLYKKTSITVIFELTYFNSSTAKQFIQLLSKLEDSEKEHKVVWKYPTSHSVMLDRGRELEILVDVPFEYVAI
ncbi:MAG: DUF1987 family protein [Crocinitomicaceae bacterium]|jgi:hypothetical protein|nr:DUF1987 family protein [Crocinitomicaceae bacterium]MBT6029388.1 DUF1987 family protein [Crocinitomicaceae bacterium]MBT6514297.1 DUF1987 family protein [Crocinitomicaceae bacterium]